MPQQDGREERSSFKIHLKRTSQLSSSEDRGINDQQALDNLQS